MFRNMYDNDVSVWSPQGRIHQIEYAMEAVKQGSATIGLKNRDYAVLIAFKRAPSELSAYQQKILTIDDHIGLSLAGLLADGRSLSHYLRNQCAQYRWSYGKPHPLNRLMSTLSNKMQIPTQVYGGRPYGVGLLLAGYDDEEGKPHIYYQCPSANNYDCRAIAIGGRSQSARTYLERHLNEFSDSDLQQLIRHGLQAVADTLTNDTKLTTKNCSVAVVGKGVEFAVKKEEDIVDLLTNIVYRAHGGAEEREDEGGADGADGGEQPPAQPDAGFTQPMDLD